MQRTHREIAIDDAARLLRTASAILHRLLEERDDDPAGGVPYWAQVVEDIAGSAQADSEKLSAMALTKKTSE